MDNAETLTAEKRALRHSMKSRLAALDPVERTRFSKEICRRILTSANWKGVGCVLAYLPIPEEVDVTPILLQGLADGKTVYAPRPVEDRLEFRRLKDAEGPWERGAFGIRTPSAAETLFEAPVNGKILVLVPGLAFDRNGRRLGRGKAYYDRFLGAPSSTERSRWLLVAPAYSLQILPEVPTGPGDIPVDAIVTENEWIDAR